MDTRWRRVCILPIRRKSLEFRYSVVGPCVATFSLRLRSMTEIILYTILSPVFNE